MGTSHFHFATFLSKNRHRSEKISKYRLLILEYSLILSMEDFEPLAYWTAADCDETSQYAGCTENLKKNSNGMWARGKAFGQIFLGGSDKTFDRHLFLAWKPEIWNSYCFTASSKNKTFRGILNNEVIYESFSYSGIHKEKKVLSLMNDVKQENRQAYGHIREGFIVYEKMFILTQEPF